MKKKKCKHCRCLFEPSPKHPNQQYCKKEKCRKARKAKWQRDKMANDEFYRQNRKDCRERRMANNPGYWKKYREKNREHTQRNREMQRVGNRKNRTKRSRNTSESISGPIAKTDFERNEKPNMSGRYKIMPCDGGNIAKTDAVIVEIIEITSACGQKRTLFPWNFLPGMPVGMTIRHPTQEIAFVFSVPIAESPTPA